MKRLLTSVLIIACLSVLMMDMTLCFFQQPFNNMFNNNFQFPGAATTGFPNMWMNNNYAWNNPAATYGAAGWNNYNPATTYGTGFGYNTGFNGAAAFPYGSNNNFIKSGAIPSSGYGGHQVITTPTREGYDVEYQFPGGRAKKYYSSQSFVQQVL